MKPGLILPVIGNPLFKGCYSLPHSIPGLGWDFGSCSVVRPPDSEGVLSKCWHQDVLAQSEESNLPHS